jgi:hypothetical protein
MQPIGRRLLLAALVAVAALVLHELRYLIGYGGVASEALASQGHGYLPAASSGVLLLFTLGVGQALLAVRRALRSATASPAPPFGVLWLASICALLMIYCGQELLEGVLSPGHPSGFAALAADGGWSALPLAAGLGLLVAVALRGVAAAEALVARRARHGRGRVRGAPRARRPRPDAERPLISVLALKLASRAPPGPVQAS